MTCNKIITKNVTTTFRILQYAVTSFALKLLHNVSGKNWVSS